jgi:hypothetical protein
LKARAGYRPGEFGQADFGLAVQELTRQVFRFDSIAGRARAWISHLSPTTSRSDTQTRLVSLGKHCMSTARLRRGLDHRRL